MKKPFLLLILISLVIISSCEQTTKSDSETILDYNTLTKVEGGKYAGGTLKTNSNSKAISLFPASISEIYSQHITNQLFEGLLKYNPKTLIVEPALAESYTIDETKTIYTFKLRKDVRFHDNECFEDGKGRLVVASDFKFVFEFICSNNTLNKSGYLLQDHIKGASDFAEGKTETLLGVNVIDDNTFEIQLNEPFSAITNIFALSQAGIFPKEALDYYKEEIINNPVGTGPYKLESNGEQIVLLKNDSYWKKDEFGNQLPLIAKITIDFEENKTQELKNFNAGKYDFVWGIPVDEIPNILGTLDEAKEGKNKNFNLQSVKNSLQVQYYGFNTENEIFKNKKVRQAFNYAINKDSIVNNILQGEGTVANHGIIPNMKGYDNSKIKGYNYDPETARLLMKEAGYPDGKGFPEIEFPYNKDNQLNELIAKTLETQLNNILNINMKAVGYEKKVVNQMRQDGTASFWRYGWIADFPDPSNFISQLHSKYLKNGDGFSYNFSRYNSSDFDKYLDKAMFESDMNKRMKYFLQAEQTMVDDAILLPMYYTSDIRLVTPTLKNFPINEIEFRDYSLCYFIPKIENKKVRVYDNL